MYFRTDHNGAGELNLPSNFPIYPRPETRFLTVLHSSHCVAGEIKRMVYFLRRAAREERRARPPVWVGRHLVSLRAACGDSGAGHRHWRGESYGPRPGCAAGCWWLTLAGRKHPGAGSSSGTGGDTGWHCRGRWPGLAARPSQSGVAGESCPGQLRRGGCGTWLRARAKLVLSRSCRDARDS